jgi:hypothetical protein
MLHDRKIWDSSEAARIVFVDPTLDIVASIGVTKRLANFWIGNHEATALKFSSFLCMRLAEISRNTHVAKGECQRRPCRFPSDESRLTAIKPRMTPSMIPIKVERNDKGIVNLRKMQNFGISKPTSSKVFRFTSCSVHQLAMRTEPWCKALIDNYQKPSV